MRHSSRNGPQRIQDDENRLEWDVGETRLLQRSVEKEKRVLRKRDFA